MQLIHDKIFLVCTKYHSVLFFVRRTFFFYLKVTVKCAERASVPLRAVNSHPTAWPVNSWGRWWRTARGSQARNVICHSTWHDTDMTCHMTWHDIWHSMFDRSRSHWLDLAGVLPKINLIGKPDCKIFQDVTYSMICHLFHIFHWENIREGVLNERTPMVICSWFRLSVWSAVGGTLALRAKIGSVSTKTFKTSIIVLYIYLKSKYKQK